MLARCLGLLLVAAIAGCATVPDTDLHWRVQLKALRGFRAMEQQTGSGCTNVAVTAVRKLDGAEAAPYTAGAPDLTSERWTVNACGTAKDYVVTYGPGNFTTGMKITRLGPTW